jgi:hypothetical protein
VVRRFRVEGRERRRNSTNISSIGSRVEAVLIALS